MVLLGRMKLTKILMITSLLGLWACSTDSDKPKPTTPQDSPTTKTPAEPLVYPKFNADSAYYFIEKQVAFGPRIPNTKAHKLAGNWLTDELGKYVDSVETQETTVTAWDGNQLEIKNIIGYINPNAKRRMMLAAHWDTRPFADEDSLNTKASLDGANDGASGIGMLLEFARIFSQQNPNIGIAIVLFDAEDYGNSEHQNSYCYGSQYWAKQQSPTKYFADKCIVLDMVGGKDAKFLMEGYSMRSTSATVYDIWKLANRLGYGNFFIQNTTQPIIDDHFYVMELANIPSIDIIDFDATRTKGFPNHWHTQADNLSVISKQTLNAVGHTILEYVYGLK